MKSGKILLICSLIFLVTSMILAQVSSAKINQTIFEDREGESAIFLPYGGVTRINTGNASFKLSYIFRVTNRPFFYGFNFSGKATNGIRSVIENGDISPGCNFDLIFGFQELLRDSDILDGWLIVKVGYEADRFKLFNPDTNFNNQITSETFTSAIFSLSFNLKIGGNKLSAISIGYKKGNNFDELEETTISNVTTIRDSATNTVRTIKNEETARLGQLKEKDSLPIKLDFFWFPANQPRIGFHHFWRTRITDDKTTNGFGTGVYLLKKKDPLNAIAGLVIELKDFSNLNQGKELKGNISVSFIGGYNFSF